MKTKSDRKASRKTGFFGPRFFWPLASLIVMILIFYFSMQDAEQSSLQSGFFSSILALFMDENLAELLVRKAAHFTIYLLLGGCVFMSAKSYGASLNVCLILAVAFCFVYAGSDEFHQLFSSGRSGQFEDVLLDTSGSVLSAVLLFETFHNQDHSGSRKTY